MKRIAEVAEEYGINVIYVDESYTSSRCPWHGDGCGIRVYRGLFKCTKLGKVFNADLIAAYNIFNDSDVEQYLDDTSNPRAPERDRR